MSEVKPTLLRTLDDDALLRQCRIETYRASGPGGQKRNKTSSAVRITHLPSGIRTTATESRSQSENKNRALKRLRLKLAIELREQIDIEHFSPPEWFASIRKGNRIVISPRHPDYCCVAGLVLDLLHAMQGSPKDTAAMLGVSTSSVIKFLESDSQLWTAANRIRAGFGGAPLQNKRD